MARYSESLNKFDFFAFFAVKMQAIWHFLWLLFFILVFSLIYLKFSNRYSLMYIGQLQNQNQVLQQEYDLLHLEHQKLLSNGLLEKNGKKYLGLSLPSHKKLVRLKLSK